MPNYECNDIRSMEICLHMKAGHDVRTQFDNPLTKAGEYIFDNQLTKQASTYLEVDSHCNLSFPFWELLELV